MGDPHHLCMSCGAQVGNVHADWCRHREATPPMEREPDHDAARTLAEWYMAGEPGGASDEPPGEPNLARCYLAHDDAEKRRGGNYLDCLEMARVAKAAGVTKEPGWYWAKPSSAENWQVGRVLKYESISGPACMIFAGVATLPVAEVYAWGPKLEPPTGEHVS